MHVFLRSKLLLEPFAFRLAPLALARHAPPPRRDAPVQLLHQLAALEPTAFHLTQGSRL